jgi:hypothetical protein
MSLDVTLVSILELDCSGTGAVSVVIYSDLPGDICAARETRSFDASAAGTRRVIRLKLAGTTKGRSFKFEITPAGSVIFRLFGARVYARNTGAAGNAWAWRDLPVTPTPEEWATVDLPIAPTSEEWQTVALSIPPTSEEWGEVALPIPPTSEEWGEVALPIPPTSEEWQTVALPIPPTPEEWGTFALPIEATPDARVWADIPVGL